MSCRFRVLTSVLTYAIAAIARDCDEGGLPGDTLQVSTEERVQEARLHRSLYEGKQAVRAADYAVSRCSSASRRWPSVDSPCDAMRTTLPLIAVWHVTGESCSSNVTRFPCGWARSASSH